MATWHKFQTSYYTKTELNSFKGLANVGVIKISDFQNSFLPGTFEKLRSLKMIETKNYITDGREITTVRLTRTGKKFVKKELCSTLYKYNPRQISHDLKLAEKYINLTQRERDTWIHEGAMSEHYKKIGIPVEKIQSGEVQTVDGCYQNSVGEWVAVEIVTSNYSAEKVAGKMAAIRYFSGGGIVDNVR